MGKQPSKITRVTRAGVETIEVGPEAAPAAPNTEDLTIPPHLRDTEDAAELSEGRKRLEKLRARRGVLIEKITIDGDDWFVKRLNLPGLNEVAVLATMLGDGTLLLRNKGVLRAVQIASIQHCLCQGETNPEPLFDPDPYSVTDELGEIRETIEAMEFVDEPGALSVVSALWLKIVELNPDILPQKKDEGGAAEL